MILLELALQGVRGFPPLTRIAFRPGMNVARTVDPVQRRALLDAIYHVMYPDPARSGATAKLADPAAKESRIALTFYGRDKATYRLVREVVTGGVSLHKFDAEQNKYNALTRVANETAQYLRVQQQLPDEVAYERLFVYAPEALLSLGTRARTRSGVAVASGLGEVVAPSGPGLPLGGPPGAALGGPPGAGLAGRGPSGLSGTRPASGAYRPGSGSHGRGPSGLQPSLHMTNALVMASGDLPGVADDGGEEVDLEEKKRDLERLREELIVVRRSEGAQKELDRLNLRKAELAGKAEEVKGLKESLDKLRRQAEQDRSLRDLTKGVGEKIKTFEESETKYQADRNKLLDEANEVERLLGETVIVGLKEDRYFLISTLLAVLFIMLAIALSRPWIALVNVLCALVAAGAAFRWVGDLERRARGEQRLGGIKEREQRLEKQHEVDTAVVRNLMEKLELSSPSQLLERVDAVEQLDAQINATAESLQQLLGEPGVAEAEAELKAILPQIEKLEAETIAVQSVHSAETLERMVQALEKEIEGRSRRSSAEGSPPAAPARGTLAPLAAASGAPPAATRSTLPPGPNVRLPPGALGAAARAGSAVNDPSRVGSRPPTPAQLQGRLPAPSSPADEDEEHEVVTPRPGGVELDTSSTELFAPLVAPLPGRFDEPESPTVPPLLDPAEAQTTPRPRAAGAAADGEGQSTLAGGRARPGPVAPSVLASKQRTLPPGGEPSTSPAQGTTARSSSSSPGLVAPPSSPAARPAGSSSSGQRVASGSSGGTKAPRASQSSPQAARASSGGAAQRGASGSGASGRANSGAARAAGATRPPAAASGAPRGASGAGGGSGAANRAATVPPATPSGSRGASAGAEASGGTRSPRRRAPPPEAVVVPEEATDLAPSAQRRRAPAQPQGEAPRAAPPVGRGASSGPGLPVHPAPAPKVAPQARGPAARPPRVSDPGAETLFDYRGGNIGEGEDDEDGYGGGYGDGYSPPGAGGGGDPDRNGAAADEHAMLAMSGGGGGFAGGHGIGGGYGGEGGASMAPDRSRDLMQAAVDMLQMPVDDLAEKLRERIAQYLMAFTDGQFERASFGARGEMEVYARGGQDPIPFMELDPASVDLVDAALRFCLAEACLSRYQIPILVDDPFTGFPPARRALLTQMFTYLSQMTQVLVASEKDDVPGTSITW